MKVYYLAHPFDSRIDMRVWELGLESRYDIEIINPFYDMPRNDVVSVDEGRRGRYEKIIPADIVSRDVSCIARSDGVIAYVNGDLSYGTIMEIVYAHVLAKEVYLICTNGHAAHPWLAYHSTEMFESREGFKAYLE
jgi:nucleoside 2-deoxyribosyltransferase